MTTGSTENTSIEGKWKLNWDYLGWRERGLRDFQQKDWDQTLVTRINEISAEIHITTQRGSAKEVRMHPIILAIVKGLEYYKNENGIESIGDRYKIVVDDSLPIDKLYVIREDEISKVVGEITILNHVKENILTNEFIPITQEVINNDSFSETTLNELIEKAKALVQPENMPSQTNTNLLTDKSLTMVTHGYLKDEQKMVFKVDVKNMTHEDRKTFIQKIKNLIKTGKYE